MANDGNNSYIFCSCDSCDQKPFFTEKLIIQKKNINKPSYQEEEENRDKTEDAILGKNLKIYCCKKKIQIETKRKCLILLYELFKEFAICILFILIFWYYMVLRPA